MYTFYKENKNSSGVVIERYEYYIDNQKCYEEYRSFVNDKFYKRRITLKEMLYLTQNAKKEKRR